MTTPNATTPKVCLDPADAVELAELLVFLGQCLDGAPEQAARWLARVAGAGYPLQALRADLDRFAFLLAACDPDTSTRLLEGPPTNRSINP